MPTHLCSVVVDSADPAAVAHFWSVATGWPAVEEEADVVLWAVQPPAGEPGLPIEVVKVDDPKVGKNRVHLDLSSDSAAHQTEQVARLLAAGASPVDIGQRDVPWIVLADPEGNELCVLEHRPVFADVGPLAAVVIDTIDPAAVANFWAAVTGWPARRIRDRTVCLADPARPGPGLALVRTDHPKVTKNRLHLDVAPPADGDQAAEVDRLLSAGATRVDVGQGPDVDWVVLADPAGNELCVLTPRDV